MVEAFPFKIQLNSSYESFPRPWNAIEVEEYGCKAFCDIMSGSLHQIRILRTAFKIGFVSVNIRLLHDSRIRFQNYRNYKNPIKSGYDGRQKKKFSRKGGPEICWQYLSFSRCRIFLKIDPELWFVILKNRFNYMVKILNYINIL